MRTCETSPLRAATAQLRSVNLRFHDLRHEAGSRLADGGVPVHEVQAQLGHTSVAQTTTYLNTTLEAREARLASIGRNPLYPLQAMRL